MKRQIPRDMQKWAPAAKLIWYVIDDYGRVDRTQIWKSTRLNQNTIDSHISSLLNSGFIESYRDRDREYYKTTLENTDEP